MTTRHISLAARVAADLASFMDRETLRSLAEHCQELAAAERERDGWAAAAPSRRRIVSGASGKAATCLNGRMRKHGGIV